MRRIAIGAAAAVVAGAFATAPTANADAESTQSVGWHCGQRADGSDRIINCYFNDRYKGSARYNVTTEILKVCDAVADHRDIYSNFFVRNSFVDSLYVTDRSGCRTKSFTQPEGTPVKFNLCYYAWNGNDCGPMYETRA